ncbi:MAG: inositol monophosphatase [Granulosicoccus sp.]
MTPIESRYAFAVDITRKASQSALELFREKDQLNIEQKGLQDWVSNADKSVEDLLRQAINDAFPEDAIVGEEHENKVGSSTFTWVIDPIDGTTNFVNGTPGWCVVLACVESDQCVCAVICDPVSNELFTASRGHGASVNGRPMRVSSSTAINQGTLGVGHSSRVSGQLTVDVLAAIMARDGLFRRSGSGALDLAYVAAGRLIGYVEPHMNAWDCIAALLMIEEAGGVVEPFDMPTMLENGGRVVTACDGVYDEVLAMAQAAYVA